MRSRNGAKAFDSTAVNFKSLVHIISTLKIQATNFKYK